ncbi:protein of unknown function [Saccharopolyspora kobensis]|uniref:eCIS core domain-containing protein n=1 Tax=Saccharopolyspora kobensis TaxID=146035 RepID=A0A1H6ALX5_9PSEU|nr:DUF4157 domain-containing protein [Saccharopolyspora kobensis]SEG48766.1 protein of unknown function [Saccharopolyspora kobensis]SFE58360.1 protein of unknown function [Saccharopolyspora kobensis]
MRAHDRNSAKQPPTPEHRPTELAENSPCPASGGPLPPRDVVALQRAIGNAATAHLLTTRGEAPDEPAQRSTVPDVLRQPGAPLGDQLRDEMEGRFGTDFSAVRLHTDTVAQRSATEIGARAYTSGQHIVTGTGSIDKHTLAHELTHVIQQRSGPVSGTDHGDGLRISDPGDRFEQEAEATATRVMTGAPLDHPHRIDAAHRTDTPAIQRQVGLEEPVLEKLHEMKSGEKAGLELFKLLLRETDNDSNADNQEALKLAKSKFDKSEPFLLIAALIRNWRETEPEKRRSEIENIVDHINEYAKLFESRLGYMAQVPIGSEFTFTNAPLKAVRPKSKKPEDILEAHKEHYEQAQERWRQAIQTLGNRRDNKAGDIPERKETRGKFNEVAYKYTFKEGPRPGGRLEKSFSYEVTLDHNVIEIVTSPYPASGTQDGQTLAKIFDQYIFGVARQAGLEADVDYGSGHINLDLAHTTGDDAQLLMRFIDAYFDDADYFKSEDPDKSNAPFMDEFDEKQQNEMSGAYDAIKKEFQKSVGDQNPWSAQRLAKELTTRVFKHNIADEPKEFSSHYQALNIEHVDERDKEARRLEIRRLPAQRDRQHLIEHLEKIQELLRRAQGGRPIA